MTAQERLALIGLGASAVDIHLPASAKLENVSVVGGADPDPGARANFAANHSDARVFADSDEMLRALEPDWVVVATPPAHHRVGCLRALGAGAHVLCEKPFVERSADAEAIVEAAQRSGRQLVLNLEFPCMPIFAAALERVGGSELGQPLFLQLWQHVYEDVDRLPGWRAEAHTMREFGTHVLDLANEIYGAFPIRVYAQMVRANAASDGDLVDVVTLTYPDGRLASIVLDRVCRGHHRYLDLRLDGEHASLRASIGGRARLQLGLDVRRRRPSTRLEFAWGGQAWLERGERRELLARNSKTPFADATARHLARAMAAARAGEPVLKDARYALELVRLCEAVYNSARSGTPVDIPPSD
jgi:predicted dehydrogenase